MRSILAIPISMILSACSTAAILEKVSFPEDRALCIKMIESLQSGDLAFVRSMMSTKYQADVVPLYPKMRKVMPSGSGTNIRLVDANFRTSFSKLNRFASLAYEIDKGSEHALVRFQIHRQQTSVTVDGLNVESLPLPIEELTKFRFFGKSMGHYLFFGISLAMLAISVLALIRLYKVKNVKRKWLWGLGCLVGFGKVTMTWPDGTVYFMLISGQFPAATMGKMGMIAPWTVSFGIPFIAILFLSRNPRLDADRPSTMTVE
jgi:hypothetical protein